MRNSELELKVPQAGLVAIDGKSFPLTSAKIEAIAQGGIAQTTLRQAYRNPYDEPLEVTYTLPLPADGAVIGFDIRVGEKRIVGEVESHDKALRKYRQALEDGRVAGILEQNRADTFTQSLGNVPPKTAVEVEIRVLHPVAFHGAPDRDQTTDAGMDSDAGSRPAEWEYRFPTVVGTRYEGEPGRVKDSDRLDVDRADGGTPVRLTLDLAIGDGAPAAVAPRSMSHAIRVEDGTDADTSIVRFEDPSRLDRDVTISWRAATDEVGVRLVEGSGLDGDKGRYGLLTIVPPNRPDWIIPRDLTLLVDASGSMSGPPIEAARELCARLVGSLSPRDSFQILSFASTVERIVGEPTAATPANIAKGIQALSRLQASGATEMAKAMGEALRPLRSESQRQVVLMTDGYIGFEQEVVERILNSLPPGARLHVVGIGSAPNRTLTRGGSRAGRGVEVLVSGTEAVEDAAARLLAATVAPVLTDITIDGAGMLNVAPARPRDVLAGQPAVIALELNAKGGDIRVSGIVQGSSEGWTRTIRVGPSVAAGNGGPKKVRAVEPADATSRTELPIGALFGREAIEDEEMRLAATRDSKEILKRIEALGLCHRIASRCTSLVAVADEQSVDPAKPRRRQRLTVEMPAGVNPEAVGYGRMGGAFVATRTAHRSPLVTLRHAEACMPDASVIEFPRFLSPPSPPPPRTVPEISARCARTEGDLLVIEFECPRDGYKMLLDGRAIQVITEDGEEIPVSIDKSLSTDAGPHASGLTLRLALRRTDGLQWKPGIVRVKTALYMRPEIVVVIA